jgi:hypothetical protein
MRRVDLDEINFETGSWELDQAAYRRLERIAHAMDRVISRTPNEIFLIEGHTDAVGSEEDNLSLSDRRAEAVAIALTETFGLASENLITQGYGEQYLKVNTQEPERANRRVAIRRITPLISQKDWLAVMTVTPKDLQDAERHVEEARQRVVEQQHVVAELERTGQPSDAARGELRQLEDALRVMEQDRELAERQLDYAHDGDRMGSSDPLRGTQARPDPTDEEATPGTGTLPAADDPAAEPGTG